MRRKKYVWTPEKDAYLRNHYDSRVAGRGLEIAKRLGWPHWAIKKRAGLLGLSRPTDRRDWTREEESFLEEHAGNRIVKWIAKKLGRTETSVILKLKRMGISRHFRKGFTASDVAESFGVDIHCVTRWIDRGLLRARRRGTERGKNGSPTKDAFLITEDDIIRFVRENPTGFRLDKVDQLFFMDLVIGGGLLRPTDSSVRGSALTPNVRETRVFQSEVFQ